MSEEIPKHRVKSDRRTEIVRHVSEEKLDRLLNEAEDPKISERLTFLKRLYKGVTLEAAANEVGKSASTGSRWARQWNEGGLSQLTSNSGGGRPPKLSEDEQGRLLEFLREGQPWKAQEIHQLIVEEFDVEYHSNHLDRFLRNLGLSYTKARPKRLSYSENTGEILEERVLDTFYENMETDNKHSDDAEKGWVFDDDIRTDSGAVVRFYDASH